MNVFGSILLFFLAFLSACSSTPKRPVEPSGLLIQARESIDRDRTAIFREDFSEAHTVRILFATNRDQLGTQLSRELSFGESFVSVSDARPVGALIPSLTRGETKAFSLEELKSKLRESRDWGTLIFIHGFNVDFNEAVLRAAQIAFDLKFQGSILLLSWPAGKTGGFLENTLINKTYESNQKNAQASVELFAGLFQELSLLAIPFQMVVHSMGHQVALPALLQMSVDIDYGFLQELVLNAPDYDPEEFEAGLPLLSKLVKRITLYCSQKDHALVASKALNGKKRLGACTRHEGVDVINVSEVDDPGLTGLGHGYYSSRPILTDLAQVFLGIRAEHRLFIRKSSGSGSGQYFLRK